MVQGRETNGLDEWKKFLELDIHQDYEITVDTKEKLTLKVKRIVHWLEIKSKNEIKKFEQKKLKDFCEWFNDWYLFRIDCNGKASKIISEIILDDKKSEIILILS